jgi:hypothetical protein
MDASLVMYDGPPPSFSDAGLLCPTPDGLPIKFNPMYSGYDGVHTYQVPAFVIGADPASITWGSSDPTMVDMQAYVSGIMITTKGVPDGGQVTIVAHSDAGCGSAPLTITAFTPEQWEAGAMRYNNGNQLTTTNLLDELDAGAYVDAGFDGNTAGYDAGDSSCFALPATFTNPFEDPPAACTDCHGPAGNSQLFGRTLFSDVSHTPEQTGGYSEAQLMAVWYTGTVPAGGYFDPNIICYTDWHLAHQWRDINTTEGQIGMNAYLRSLAPKEQEGCFDLFSSCDSGM